MCVSTLTENTGCPALSLFACPPGPADMLAQSRALRCLLPLTHRAGWDLLSDPHTCAASILMHSTNSQPFQIGFQFASLKGTN